MAVRRTDQLAEWRTKFSRIYSDVGGLLEQRLVYREIHKIVGATEERFNRLDRTVFEWLRAMHAQSAAVAVRRQASSDKKSISLRKLLDEILARPHLLTRTEHVARAALVDARDPDDVAEERARLDQRFDELAGQGAELFPASTVRSDIARLVATTDRIGDYVNYEIGHLDARGITTGATFPELNAAIDLLEELVIRYAEVLGSDSPARIPARLPRGWDNVFRMPWILEAMTT